MRVLVIEDDKRTADYILKGLRQAGHTVNGLENGRDGLSCAVDEEHDVIVLDRMLPGLDGMSVVRALRSAGNDTPMLFLTAVGGLDDRVDGMRQAQIDPLVRMRELQ